VPTLLTTLPRPDDLLALMPEELAGILIEIIPRVSQRSGFLIDHFIEQLFPLHGGYPPQSRDAIAVALAEALSWLVTQGIIVRNPNQPADWYLLTKRGQQLRSRTDLDAFRHGRTLPSDLLQQFLVEKVHHLFLRGDYDTAVFQAFKELEVAVRKVADFPESLVGRDLMQKAFNPSNGPLRDETLILAEREAEMFLFAGAIGHAKNPTSHRDVNLTKEEAARLIIFASYLLDRVSRRLF
jgi:uncharacterized protein (TIGR02391 family)